MSLGATLGIAFGLLVALAIGTVLSLSLYSNYTNTLSLLNSRSVTSVRLLEENLDRHLAPARDIVDFLARLFADGQFDFDDRARADAILRGASAGDPDVAAIILYRLDTDRRFGVFRGPGDRYGSIDDEAITNPMIQRELMDGAPPDRVVWGKPVIVDGNLFANVRRALVRDGAVQGYVVAAIAVRRVSGSLSAAGAAESATAFIIDSNNRILVHPKLAREPAIEGSQATGEAALNLLAPKLALFEDAVLRRFPDRQPAEIFQDAAAASVEVSVLDLNDQDNDPESNFLFLTKKTDAYSAEPWTLGLYYPAHAVNTEVRRLMASLFSGVVLLVVAVIAAALLGRRMATPVRRITGVADRVAALDLKDIDSLPESRIREFDVGSRTMNQMVDAISAFSTYVPRALVAKLIERGAEETGRPAEMELTVMFTDIAGFTARSETMGAAETAEFLNRHFAALGTAIGACGGTIDKYMGDGLMAFWGAPEPMPDHAARACEAARRIAAAVAAQNSEIVAAGGEPVRIRIGIHTGPTIVGNIGAESRVDYTVVGDTVNICARLQELGRVVDGSADIVILISEQTMAEAGLQDGVVALGQHRLRGRGQETAIFRLMA